MPYDSLLALINEINKLSNDGFSKLMFMECYNLKKIIDRFSILYSYKKLDNEKKIFSESNLKEILDFISKDTVNEFLVRVFKNIEIWKRCKFMNIENQRKLLNYYFDLTDRWEKMQKQKDLHEQDK